MSISRKTADSITASNSKLLSNITSKAQKLIESIWLSKTIMKLNVSETAKVSVHDDDEDDEDEDKNNDNDNDNDEENEGTGSRGCARAELESRCL